MESAQKQTVSAELGLRELILQGRLRAGDRLVEQDLVRRLGVSRTPVRAALARLESEGLLVAWPGGGYAVASFTAADVADAIDVRGTLEGMAARLAAENGLTRRVHAQLADCVAALDEVVEVLDGTDEPFLRYVEHNERFHAVLVRASDNRMLRAALERVVALPFASPSAFVRAQAHLPETLGVVRLAQRQHHDILAAIETGDAERAEDLSREHARMAKRNLDYALRDADAMRAVAGANLIGSGAEQRS
ncbi:GntR family transcriptional regulator [Spiractinospora alimapuensis]|uniref:GntR family transcriptional regulator n=1 Tax=Spiractinospora alimapuensis TaxID=2820884 RepID=UPI001F1FBAAE|nr:GntR family transcriptional regulator [Spiractinospora alimapuensis]QVQ53555.1 GntR family transcriptional regulator [Spiractinospora alimapuensis]